MDDIVLKAIIGSIFKWDSIAFGYGEDLGANNCELCKTFSCINCPYYLHTETNRLGVCGPAYRVWRSGTASIKAKSKKEIHAAKQVWLELLSLLPQEEY